MKKLLWLGLGLLIPQNNILASLDWGTESEESASRSTSPVTQPTKTDLSPEELEALVKKHAQALMDDDSRSVSPVDRQYASTPAAAAAAHTTAAVAHAAASDAHAVAAGAHTAAAATIADVPLTAGERAAFNGLFPGDQEEQDPARETPPFRLGTPGVPPVDGPDYTSSSTTPANVSPIKITVGAAADPIYTSSGDSSAAAAAAAAAKASEVAADASDLATQATAGVVSDAGGTPEDIASSMEKVTKIQKATTTTEREGLLKNFYQWLISKDILKSWAQGKLTNLYIDDAMVNLSPWISSFADAHATDFGDKIQSYAQAFEQDAGKRGLRLLKQQLTDNRLLNNNTIAQIQNALIKSADKSIAKLKARGVTFDANSSELHINNFIKNVIAVYIK